MQWWPSWPAVAVAGGGPRSSRSQEGPRSSRSPEQLCHVVTLRFVRAVPHYTQIALKLNAASVHAAWDQLSV